MLHYLGLVLWISLGSAGVLLLYASLSYETEDGKIQSLLEEWWVRIDDFRQGAISFHVAFMKVIASVMTRFMDRLFGNRMLSLQSFGVSACYSIVWIGLAILILSKLNPKSQSETSHLVWLIVFGLVYGSLPALGTHDEWKFLGFRFIHFWFGGLVFAFIWNFVNPFGYIILWGLVTPGLRMGALIFFVIFLGIIFSIFLFTTFISVMRITLRTIARSQSPIKIVGLSLLNATPLLTFYVLFKLLVWWPDRPGKVAEIGLLVLLVLMICGILFNFAFVLSAVLFVCLAVTMLLHRLFWPAIARPLYKLQALGIAKRPKVFAAI